MLVATIIIGCVAFIVCYIANTVWRNARSSELKRKAILIIAIILVIITCALIISISWNEFTAFYVLGFLILCAAVAFRVTKFKLTFDMIGVAFIIAAIIGILVDTRNFEEEKSQEVKVTTLNLVAAKDNYRINGNMQRSIFYVTGSISEKAEYTFYYQLEGGGIKQGRINADSTTIYYVEDCEEPHLEIIETTPYKAVYYKGEHYSRLNGVTSITYKLYVPEGSVQNVYEFDAN